MTTAQRIMVIGPMGAGKSTFSIQLGQQLQLPVVHLDRYYWQKNWQAPTTEHWRQIINELSSQDQWIMDGNYSGTWDIRTARAERIIWLDYPRHIYLYRILKRRIIYHNQRRPDLEQTEQLDWSAVKHTWHYRAKRQKYEERLRSSSSAIHIIRHPNAAYHYLAQRKQP